MEPQTETNNRRKRDAGSGTLIPPRLGVSRFWSVQFWDVNGKQIRRSRFPNTSKKVTGELKPGHDPKLPESWTNISAAKQMAQEWAKQVSGGDVSVGHDPSQLCYSDLRKLYLDDLADKKAKSLRKRAGSNEIYVDSLTHLDPFMGFEKPDDRGVKVSRIDSFMITKFKDERKADGASTGTINRSLAALRRMFSLAMEHQLIKHAPVIKTAPEGEPRQGFLSIEDYDALYAAFPEYIRNLLQVGYYTGMRREEILSLTWSQVHLDTNVVELFETKNGEKRVVPLLDGLPELLENLRRANPEATGNDVVFMNRDGFSVGSFNKVWQKACVKFEVKTNLYGRETVSHFSKGHDPAKELECCAACKGKFEYHGNRPVEVGEYVGLIFHDLRRTAISNFRKAGVDPITTMAVSGHKDPAVFRRYNIINADDMHSAGQKVTEHLKQLRKASAEAPAKSKLRAVK
jgi:integrase